MIRRPRQLDIEPEELKEQTKLYSVLLNALDDEARKCPLKNVIREGAFHPAAALGSLRDRYSCA
jgi:hypothetical protein